MTCASASFPQETWTYNLNNNTNKEKQRTTSESKVEYFSSWEFWCFDSLPLVDCSFSCLTLCSIWGDLYCGFWCIMDGGWLRAVPCGKMEESLGGRAAIADCFLSSPGTLGIAIMRRSAGRSTVLCHVSCYDLHVLHIVYQHLPCPQKSSFPWFTVQSTTINALSSTLCMSKWNSPSEMNQEIQKEIKKINWSKRKL